MAPTKLARGIDEYFAKMSTKRTPLTSQRARVRMDLMDMPEKTPSYGILERLTLEKLSVAQKEYPMMIAETPILQSQPITTSAIPDELDILDDLEKLLLEQIQNEERQR